jgi:hypothetical protein
MTRPRRGRVILIVVAVFFVLFIISAIIGSGSIPQAKASSALNQAELEGQKRDDSARFSARTVVRAMMKDPSSAVFSHDFAWTKNGHETACGDVNAKNSFGAMTGDEPWIVIPDRDVAMVRSFDNADAFDREWDRDCVGLQDRAAPAPKEFVGVKLGASAPATLQPYQGNDAVLTPKASAAADYLGVHLDKIWFMTDVHKISSGSGTAKGGFAKLADALFRAYGLPNTDTASESRLIAWEWPTAKVTVRRQHE